jgi:pimeloyl-ACP methyl ester carboxylesterase
MSRSKGVASAKRQGITRALDTSAAWLADAIDQQPTWLPGLTATHLLEGCGHWLQQERPDQVNDLILDWLRKPAGEPRQTDTKGSAMPK